LVDVDRDAGALADPADRDVVKVDLTALLVSVGIAAAARMFSSPPG
jgi:hypothetical protein